MKIILSENFKKIKYSNRYGIFSDMDDEELNILYQEAIRENRENWIEHYEAILKEREKGVRR